MQSQYPVIEAVLMGIRAMKASPLVVARESYLGAVQRARLRKGSQLRARGQRQERLSALQLRHAERITDLFVQLHPHAIRMRQKDFYNFRIKLLSGIFLN